VARRLLRDVGYTPKETAMYFEDEVTQEFVRVDAGDSELALEDHEAWFWSDDECDDTTLLDSISA
jgi:hypothetical protein